MSHAGGYEYDGAEIAAVDEVEVRAAVREEWAAGTRSFVVAGVFSPVKPDQEDSVGRIVETELASLAGGEHFIFAAVMPYRRLQHGREEPIGERY